MKKILMPLVIILVGAGAMVTLIQSGEAEQRVEVTPAALKVQVIPVQQSQETVNIYASGVVQPSHQVNLVPQVQGRIVYTASDLRSGRQFSKGDVIAKIEAVDYQLAVQQEQSRVEQAKLSLVIERERQADAQREWELLGNTGNAPDLASRNPQLRLAEIAVDAAKAGLERAELALSRTIVKAPFDCVVQQEQLEIGQVVGGSPVATLQGTEQFQVRISVPTRELSHILIPGINSETGSAVNVSFDVSGSDTVIRAGRVLGLESSLDAQARTAQILVGIDNPLEGEGLPLMIGAYVDVSIVGRDVTKALRLPSAALREGSYVLVADSEGLLARRDVSIGWYDQEDVVIVNGLNGGEQVITTAISYPIYGAPVEIVE